jgi:hypothetical protein
MLSFITPISPPVPEPWWCWWCRTEWRTGSPGQILYVIVFFHHNPVVAVINFFSNHRKNPMAIPNDNGLILGTFLGFSMFKFEQM